jgi:hypothetical protein
MGSFARYIFPPNTRMRHFRDIVRLSLCNLVSKITWSRRNVGMKIFWDSRMSWWIDVLVEQIQVSTIKEQEDILKTWNISIWIMYIILDSLRYHDSNNFWRKMWYVCVFQSSWKYLVWCADFNDSKATKWSFSLMVQAFCGRSRENIFLFWIGNLAQTCSMIFFNCLNNPPDTFEAIYRINKKSRTADDLFHNFWVIQLV